MSLPYPVVGTITDVDASHPNGARVVLRNDTNGERTYGYTNSLGQYALDAANLTSGYLTTDRITLICRYGDAEVESSILISSNTHTVNMTLVTVSESSDLTYCQVQDVLDELGDKTTSDISYNRVRKIILRAEAEIDERAGTSFKVNTATDEIHDYNESNTWKSVEQMRIYGSDMLVGTRSDYMSSTYNDRIKLDHYPVISITSLYKNNGERTGADSWVALTQQTGSGGDFILESDTGMITFINNYPSIGMRKVKVTYTYGKSTVPKVVERLCILLSVRDILISKGTSSQFDSTDNISLEGISISKGISGSVSYFNWLNEEIDRLWKIVGELNGEFV